MADLDGAATPLTCARCERSSVGMAAQPGAVRCQMATCYEWVQAGLLTRIVASLTGRNRWRVA